MNVPAELDKIEARLSPNARFAAWLQHQSAGDERVASRLRNGGARLDIYMIWKPTNLFYNALKDAAGLFYVMVRDQVVRLEMLPLVIHMAGLADDYRGFADYLQETGGEHPIDCDDDATMDEVHEAAQMELDRINEASDNRWYLRMEALRPHFVRQLALWWRAWEAFCADEKIEPKSALHAIGCPIVADLERYAQDIDAYEPTSEDGAEIDERRETILSAYARYLERMTVKPYERGQTPLRSRRAPRKEPTSVDPDRELHDDLSYLNDVAAAAARIDHEEVLLTPIASEPDADDDQDGCA